MKKRIRWYIAWGLYCLLLAIPFVLIKAIPYFIVSVMDSVFYDRINSVRLKIIYKYKPEVI